MIITCPTCLRKYEVDQKSIGDGRMVRCIICGTTWQQELGHIVRKERRTFKLPYHWLFSIMFFIATYFFACEYTPVCSNIGKYQRLILSMINPGIKNIEIKNIAHKFVLKDDGVYVSLSGDIVIDKYHKKNNPKLMFNLKPYFPQKYDISHNDRDVLFNETWEEKVNFNDVDESIINFQTVFKKIPKHDIICTIDINI